MFFDDSLISDFVYRREKKKAYQYAETQKRKAEIYQIKYGKPKQKRSFSKLTTVFLYVNLTVVEAFCMAIMWRTMDLSALPTFITCIIGEILVHFISCEKSKRENMQGGIVHDTAMLELQNKIASTTTEVVNDSTDITEIEYTGEAVG